MIDDGTDAGCAQTLSRGWIYWGKKNLGQLHSFQDALSKVQTGKILVLGLTMAEIRS